MPPDVDIEEVQAEIAEQQSKMEHASEAKPPQSDLIQQMREALARDNWRLSRLCSD